MLSATDNLKLWVSISSLMSAASIVIVPSDSETGTCECARHSSACGTLLFSGSRSGPDVNNTAETEPETQRTGARRQWNQGAVGAQAQRLQTERRTETGSSSKTTR